MELGISPVPQRVTPDDLINVADRSAKMLHRIRDSMLQPHPRKEAPVFPSNKVQALCGIDKTKMNTLLKAGKLPQGTQESKGKMRRFTLAETMQWVEATVKPKKRGKGKKGRIITVGNFKGGVTKTSTAMNLAQGLTLRRGRRVLIIDLDPQGSTTTLFGINPNAEIDVDQTVLPVIDQSQADLRYAPMKTYWDNLDLIPASSDLFNAEFLLPAQVHQGDASFQFWQVLRNALEPLRDDYDYIILDTAPTLSYLTINSIFAADSMLVPIVPDVLSYSSMVQFWSLFSDLVNGMRSFGRDGEMKSFDSIEILISRMPNKTSAQLVNEWIRKTYGSYVSPIEIPETELARTTSTEFKTIYDMPNYDGSAEAYRRIRDPYDKLVDMTDDRTCRLWDTEEVEAQ
ncbi:MULTISPECIES: ParA family protein [Massilia]|uniref:ParA family protein n=2 Tax=Telluria group TaxID=2895353 RepID=UPI00047FB04A|nr:MULTISPECIES: ParA family protein [Massilia]MDK6076198.1 ParA family protein [Massilia varians]